MRGLPTIATACLASILVAAPTRAGDAPGALTPYEDILEVVALLTWHEADDLYRFPPPKDATGHDVFSLSLERLGNWEKRFPDRFRDVTTLARAKALERLGEWARAARSYEQVAGMDTALAATARTALPRVQAFADAAALPEDGASLDQQLEAIRRKLDAWGALTTGYAGTPYEGLARLEEERLERTAAALVVQHRRLLADGTATAERALRFLIQKHADSRQLPAHVLRLGDLYADIAREYAEAVAARPLAFAETEFRQRVDRALDTYGKVAAWDGVPEKPEGQARYAALDAFKTSVLERHR